MAVIAHSVADRCRAARDASRAMAALDSETKNAAVNAMADAHGAPAAEIIDANGRDMEAGRQSALSPALLDRLALDERRVRAMADGVRAIAALPDPVGEVIDGLSALTTAQSGFGRRVQLRSIAPRSTVASARSTLTPRGRRARPAA